jgi:branched-chain amino acid transport system ATP-binding protein
MPAAFACSGDRPETQPSILLLNEPTTGLAPVIVQGMFRSLLEIDRTTGAAIVMVEQNVASALRLVQRAIVLKTGQVIFDAPAAELAAHGDLWSWFRRLRPANPPRPSF